MLIITANVYIGLCITLFVKGGHCYRYNGFAILSVRHTVGSVKNGAS